MMTAEKKGRFRGRVNLNVIMLILKKVGFKPTTFW